MNIQNQRLLIEQLDQKISLLNPLKRVIIPEKGWVFTIRMAMKMSLRQLGNRLKISAQGVRDMENREANSTISVKSLQEIAEALDMKFVYGFIPKEGSIENIIENRANEKAREIVLRTSNTMKLEDQENSEERIAKAIKGKAEEIKNKMPGYLWD